MQAPLAEEKDGDKHHDDTCQDLPLVGVVGQGTGRHNVSSSREARGWKAALGKERTHLKRRSKSTLAKILKAARSSNVEGEREWCEMLVIVSLGERTGSLVLALALIDAVAVAVSDVRTSA